MTTTRTTRLQTIATRQAQTRLRDFAFATLIAIVSVISISSVGAAAAAAGTQLVSR